MHSSYLLAGAGERPRRAALEFVRALACAAGGPTERPCEGCAACRRSRELEQPVVLDAKGRSGPLYRHVGEHPDLFWLECAPGATRVSIGQVRSLQNALRLGANEGGWRAAVIADADRLSEGAQNALLHLLEEPPARTCLLLVSGSAAALLATIRSRCARIVFPAERRPPLRAPERSEEALALVSRLDALPGFGLPELLDWAQEYRGNRAIAAQNVDQLLDLGSEWLRERTIHAVAEGRDDTRMALRAYKSLLQCRRDLVTRNANPQMVAERGLIALREAV